MYSVFPTAFAMSPHKNDYLQNVFSNVSTMFSDITKNPSGRRIGWWWYGECLWLDGQGDSSRRNSFVGPSEEELHRGWISTLRQFPPDSPRTEMAMSMFVEHNTAHRPSYLPYETLQTQKSPTYVPYLRSWIFRVKSLPLLEQLAGWCQRPVVRQTEALEKIDEIGPSSIEMNSVYHPPSRYQNRQYAALMTHYYVVSLFFILLVKDGGPRNPPDRLPFAIDLCRT